MHTKFFLEIPPSISQPWCALRFLFHNRNAHALSIFTLYFKLKSTGAVIRTSGVNGNQSIRIQELAILLKTTYTCRVNSTLSLIFVSSQLSVQLSSVVSENQCIIYYKMSYAYQLIKFFFEWSLNLNFYKPFRR